MNILKQFIRQDKNSTLKHFGQMCKEKSFGYWATHQVKIKNNGHIIGRNNGKLKKAIVRFEDKSKKDIYLNTFENNLTMSNFC